MTKPVFESLILDLQVDKALSEGQVKRHYVLGELSHLPEPFFMTTCYVATTHHSRTFREVRFIVLEKRYTQASAHVLRHLAAVAEMRRCLQVKREDWSFVPEASFSFEKPDALWQSPFGEIAIEFDAGSYSSQKIKHKIEAFKRYSAQRWGSSSQKRVLRLSGHLQASGVVHEPLLLNWT
ncbi:MAG: hypothetical protein KC422_19985 [Trueperaceae bacterium]|nr:hypothetical protein [Trueperaceae bacterium]